jgi:hypothetical protein
MRTKLTSMLILTAFISVFSDFLPKHSIKFSELLYRFSYSEEFETQQFSPIRDPYFGLIPVYTIGRPRSDEYGATFGAEFGYNFFHRESKLSLGINFSYARSLNHTYDGSFQGQDYFFFDNTGNPVIWVVYEPYKEENKDNFFYAIDIKIGFPILAPNQRAIFEPKITTMFDGWKRPVGIIEYYYWIRMCPGISLTTKSAQNLGFISDLSLAIPIHQRMHIPIATHRYKFDIGGKVGWNLDLGLVRYLKENCTIKITYFYENYGFKQSPPVNLAGIEAYEPSSSTHNHGVKLTFEKGFGR